MRDFNCHGLEGRRRKNRDVVFKHLNKSQLKIRVVVRFRPHPLTTSRLLQDIYDIYLTPI
jgi:hypothetical protein